MLETHLLTIWNFRQQGIVLVFLSNWGLILINDLLLPLLYLYLPFYFQLNLDIKRKLSCRSDPTRVELLLGFKFAGKMVKLMEFTGKIGKAGKR